MMGTLRSLTNHTGTTINGILLGDPVISDGAYVWDDSALPDGWMDEAGAIEVAP